MFLRALIVTARALDLKIPFIRKLVVSINEIEGYASNQEISKARDRITKNQRKMNSAVQSYQQHCCF